MTKFKKEVDEMEKEFLTKLGIADDVAAQIITESNKDVQTVQTQLDTANTQLSEANTAIQSYKDMDVDGIKKSVDDWKQKYEKAEDDRKSFEYKTKIGGYVKSLNLRDDVYENYMTSQLIEKGLQFDGDKLIGGDDVVSAFRETHEDAFRPNVNERTAAPAHNTTVNRNIDGVEAEFMAKNPNLKID